MRQVVMSAHPQSVAVAVIPLVAAVLGQQVVCPQSVAAAVLSLVVEV